MARRARNEVVDDGRYSARIEGEAEMVEGDGWRPNLKGRALRVRVAVRDNMAAKCGAVLDKDSNLLVSEGFLEETQERFDTIGRIKAYGLGSFLIPYFANVE